MLCTFEVRYPDGTRGKEVVDQADEKSCREIMADGKPEEWTSYKLIETDGRAFVRSQKVVAISHRGRQILVYITKCQDGRTLRRAVYCIGGETPDVPLACNRHGETVQAFNKRAKAQLDRVLDAADGWAGDRAPAEIAGGPESVECGLCGEIVTDALRVDGDWVCQDCVTRHEEDCQQEDDVEGSGVRMALRIGADGIDSASD